MNILDESEKIMEFQESASLKQRLLCFPSLRELKISGKDSITNQKIIDIHKLLKIPFLSKVI
jgi:hypothetical protein